MPVATSKQTFPAPTSKHETARQWIQRRLRKPATETSQSSEKRPELRKKLSFGRPRTAPSATPEWRASVIPALPEIPPMPPIPLVIELPNRQSTIHPPLRPQRPNSGVVRDVSAWLDASSTVPSPPLMSGLSYWRAATGSDVRDTAGMQHAVPIVREPEDNRPSTAHSSHMRTFRRRAKKMQAQMPSLLRTRSQKSAIQKQINRRSASMPVLAIAYEQTQQAEPPRIITRSRSFLRPTPRPSASSLLPRPRGFVAPSLSSVDNSPRSQGSAVSIGTKETRTSSERRLNAFFGLTTRSTYSTRPSTAGAPAARVDSMGDLSDAPTYFTGPPPPSYRSRAASILTTSSFGCVDGMNTAQRHMSQQRAANRRGVKGRFRRLAHNWAA